MDKIPLPPDSKYWSVADVERWLRWATWERWATVAVVCAIVPLMTAFLIFSIMILGK